MIYNTISPCKKKKGFEGYPDEFYNVPLTSIKDNLLDVLDSYQLLRETKVCLILKEEGSGNKISIFPSLRAFIYGDVEKKEATSIFDKISKSVEKTVSS
jgi:hypothetical protein